MKKYLLLIIIMFFCITDVYATGGGLRKNSIKTCPDGVTYGMHGDGNGGTHWHRAATNGHNYYAVGDAIYGDPCPGNNTNQGTAESTQGNNNNSNNNNNNNNNNYGGYTPTPAPTPTPEPKEEPKKEEQEDENKVSDNTSIKKLVVNDEEVKDIKGEMEVVVYSKKVNIEVELKSKKAKYKIVNMPKTFSLNEPDEVEIVVTAESGKKQSYFLTITREARDSTDVKPPKVKVNNHTIEPEYFEDDKSYKLSVQNYESKVLFTYELRDDIKDIKVFKEGKDVTNKNTKIEVGYNYFTLRIIDKEDNYQDYKIDIQRETLEDTIYAVIGGFVLLGLILKFTLFKKK